MTKTRHRNRTLRRHPGRNCRSFAQTHPRTVGGWPHPCFRSECRSDPREDLQSKSAWGQETVRPPRAPGPGRPGLAGIVSAPLSRDLRHAFSRERGETVRGQTASMMVKGPKHFSQDIGNLSHAGPGSDRFHDRRKQVLFTGSRGLHCTQNRLYPGIVAL